MTSTPPLTGGKRRRGRSNQGSLRRNERASFLMSLLDSRQLQPFGYQKVSGTLQSDNDEAEQLMFQHEISVVDTSQSTVLE